MNSLQLETVSSKDIWANLNILIDDFLETYPFYDKWCEEIYPEIKIGKRCLYNITWEQMDIGLILVNRILSYVVKINTIYLFPQFRNQGFGSSALNLLIEEYYRDVNYVFTQCKSSNYIAKKLFKAKEFEFVGILVHQIENASDNEVFCRILNKDLDINDAISLAKTNYTVPGRKKFLPLRDDTK